MLLVVALVVVLVAGGRDSTPDVPAATQGPTSASVEPTESPSNAGPCGLSPDLGTTTLTRAPEAVWAYEGTMAYPTSTTFGPAQVSSEGYRRCFQQSAAGALFAAANAAAQIGADMSVVRPWLSYFVAEGPFRDAFLATLPEEGESAPTAASDTRTRIAGFRLLSFTGDAARVDLALVGSGKGQAVNVSMIYELVWHDDDWRLSVADPTTASGSATLPSLAGYVLWQE